MGTCLMDDFQLVVHIRVNYVPALNHKFGLKYNFKGVIISLRGFRWSQMRANVILYQNCEK